LSTLNNQSVLTTEPVVLQNNQNNASIDQARVCFTLPAAMGMGGGYVPMIANTLTNRYDGSPNPAKQQGANIVTQAISVDEKMGQTYIGHDIGNTLGARDYKQPQAVVASYGIDHAITTGGNSTAQGPCIYEDMEGTLKASGPHAVFDARSIGNGQLNQMTMAEQANTLDTMHDQQAALTYGLDRASFNQGENAKYDFSIEEELIGAQTARGPGAVFNSVVRRLTPLECERLQGFPDGWTDIGDWTDSKGKLHKAADGPRYKALGNSIAVGYANGQSGFWCWMARRICAQYERQITMASLFDGIGGFPLAFQAAGAIPVWASEIEEFPIAVTKIRFPDKEE